VQELSGDDLRGADTVGPNEVGVGPWQGERPDDPRLDPELLAAGDPDAAAECDAETEQCCEDRSKRTSRRINSIPCAPAARDGWSETRKRDSISIVHVTSCHA
jgi:hypothetical protein